MKLASWLMAIGALLVAHATGAATQSCPGDSNGDGEVTVDEIVAAVTTALNGCPGVPERFVVSDAGTIADTQTGLMWERLNSINGINHSGAVYDWTTAINKVKVLNGETAGCMDVGYPSRCCTGVGKGSGCEPFAGYTDWRLPRIEELQTILDYGTYDPAVSEAFDSDCSHGCTTCSCTGSWFHWSSSMHQGVPDEAWTVNFQNGIVDHVRRNNVTHHVRAVRDGTGSPSGTVPVTWYVRTNGHDANDGKSPNRAVRNINAALDRAKDGDTILVGPGTYLPPDATPGVVVEITARPAPASRPLILRADPTGLSTDDPAGDVVLDANGGIFAIRITGSSGITVDGFTVRGSQGTGSAGVHVRGSSRDITVRNCVIVENHGDGVRVDSSHRTLIFNNLIYDNANRGIQVSGSADTDTVDTRLINNTVADNGDDGISIGGGRIEDCELRNNILYDNAQRGIDVDSNATAGYDADYNLLFPIRRNGVFVDYGTSTPKGINDISFDPRFVEHFRLAQESAGDPRTSAAVDAGDDSVGDDLRRILRGRTTARSDALDTGILDLGFHFLSPLSPRI